MRKNKRNINTKKRDGVVYFIFNKLLPKDWGTLALLKTLVAMCFAKKVNIKYVSNKNCV